MTNKRLQEGAVCRRETSIKKPVMIILGQCDNKALAAPRPGQRSVEAWPGDRSVEAWLGQRSVEAWPEKRSQ
jgi:hypothetical protein